jgi:hypothetical protein
MYQKEAKHCQEQDWDKGSVDKINKNTDIKKRAYWKYMKGILSNRLLDRRPRFTKLAENKLTGQDTIGNHSS